jgi:hypothetical protein
MTYEQQWALLTAPVWIPFLAILVIGTAKRAVGQ